MTLELASQRHAEDAVPQPRSRAPRAGGLDVSRQLWYVDALGRRIDYQACVRLIEIPRADDDRRPVGWASVTSFVRLFGGRCRMDRPVMVMFNGGPIVSSGPLLLSGIGPKRARFSENLDLGAVGPYGLDDSPESVLADCDLIVIDPVGCGYGGYAADVDVPERYSASEDARQFAHITATWMAQEGRLGSQLYILGESYGTVRAPLMAKALLELPDNQIATSGMVLLGETTNIQEMHDRPRNILGAVAALPLMAAVAQYHHRGSPDITDWRDAIEQARAYAYGPYLTALWKGSGLSRSARERIAGTLERFTGIDASVFSHGHLHISKDRFRNMLLERDGKVVGMYDARYASPASQDFHVDPSEVRAAPVISAGVHEFYHELLGVDRMLSRMDNVGDVWSAWNWSTGNTSAPATRGERKSPFDEFDYTASLEYWLRQVPESKLMVANGCYDTITTVGAADALIASIDVPVGRIVQRIYPAGHMTYTDAESGRRLCEDLRAFITGGGPTVSDG